jgi:hypothetical protein
MPLNPEDFAAGAKDIIPGADPTAVSQTEKLMKAQGLMEMLGAGMPLDPVKVMIRLLEAQEQPNWQELIPPQILQSGQMPPPPPDPKQQEMQMKMQIEQAKAQSKMQSDAQHAEIEKSTAAAKLAMEKQKHAQDLQSKQDQAIMDRSIAEHKQKIFMAEGALKLQQTAVEGQQAARHAEDTHHQQLRHGEELGKAKVEQQKAAAKAKPTKGAKD